eukprot:gnl/TRDRNA2_/TRDRNA2_131447_c0_seq1.p1 gnl/TRDRNA2_/TRDRNA2_131447_c0~~gnl/TRDRNA2_/TRDRNA2_131447_c0_seq1.p1  ORF type:complete len:1067 (+),score=193.37 gnl/TRDRNA2_/TRDRNA2_131447_c0_seq1:50-3250(+)
MKSKKAAAAAAASAAERKAARREKSREAKETTSSTREAIANEEAARAKKKVKSNVSGSTEARQALTSVEAVGDGEVVQASAKLKDVDTGHIGEEVGETEEVDEETGGEEISEQEDDEGEEEHLVEDPGLSDLEEVFTACDLGGTGRLGENELRCALHAAGLYPDDAVVAHAARGRPATQVETEESKAAEAELMKIEMGLLFADQNSRDARSSKVSGRAQQRRKSSKTYVAMGQGKWGDADTQDCTVVNAAPKDESGIIVEDFKDLVRRAHREQGAPGAMRQGRRVVPHSRRGVTFGQIEDLHEGYVASGWLQVQCDAANEMLGCHSDHGESWAEASTATESAAVKKMQVDTHALQQFVVCPLTDPRDRRVPLDIRLAANTPLPPVERISYSELANPKGAHPDYFISHSWGHALPDLQQALQRCAHRAATTDGNRHAGPQDVTFWLAVFAINQHRISEEVGHSPDQGPCIVSMAQALAGGVVILDETAESLTRAWCLFEIDRLASHELPWEFFCSSGPVAQFFTKGPPPPIPPSQASCAGDTRQAAGAAGRRSSAKGEQAKGKRLSAAAPAQGGTTLNGPAGLVRRLSQRLSNLSTFDAGAGCDSDKHAIWHCVCNPGLRQQDLAMLLRKEAFHPESFSEFEGRLAATLGQSLLSVCLRARDRDAVLSCIVAGADFSKKDLAAMGNLSMDPRTVQAVMKSIWLDGATSKCSLLHCAASHGHSQAVSALLSLKADLEARDSELGETPLHWALRTGHHDTIVQQVLTASASINVFSRTHATPLHWAAAGGHVGTVTSILERATRNKQFFDPKKDKHGTRPLHYAAAHGHVEVTEMLLDCGENVEVQDPVNCDATPLHLAAMDGHADVVKLLLRRSANAECEDADGDTPINYASINGRRQVVYTLMQHVSDSRRRRRPRARPTSAAAMPGQRIKQPPAITPLAAMLGAATSGGRGLQPVTSSVTDLHPGRPGASPSDAKPSRPSTAAPGGRTAKLKQSPADLEATRGSVASEASGPLASLSTMSGMRESASRSQVQPKEAGTRRPSTATGRRAASATAPSRPSTAVGGRR